MLISLDTYVDRYVLIKAHVRCERRADYIVKVLVFELGYNVNAVIQGVSKVKKIIYLKN